MASIKSCGPICQHPSCWNNEKDKMIEALKRFFERSYLGSTDLEGVRPPQFEDREVEISEPLPTLKIINLFGSEDDFHDTSYENSAYNMHSPDKLKECSYPISSAATRSSKLPKAPCVSPSPSYASQYFHKKKKKETEKCSSCLKISENIKATNIQITENINEESEFMPTFVPYLIWVPSKKCKSLLPGNNDRTSQVPKVSMKNITGNNSDFGFLSTPYSKDNTLKCYSRATHTVRSSPNRLQPRRLPPISRDDKSRAERNQATVNDGPDIHLSGDGIIKAEKRAAEVDTPHNTRASIYTNVKMEEWEPEVSTMQDANVKQSLCILDEDTLIIQHGIKQEKLLNDLNKASHNKQRFIGSNVKEILKPTEINKDLKELREELLLPKVTVPKAKLSKLPIDDHCKNSIPSHNLPDIEMQPIYGTDTTISRATTLDSGLSNPHSDANEVNGAASEEVLLSEEQYQKLFESVVTEKRNGLHASEEELVCQWEADSIHAPAPTPSSPSKRPAPIALNDSEVIDIVKEEQSVNPTNDPLNLDSQETKDTETSSGAQETSRTSPVLSKASSGDWPSDKDIMRQTYEQYRSFTPFKTPGISIMDARLESIREASREQTNLTEKEKTMSPKTFTVSINGHVFPSPLKMAMKKEGKKMKNIKKKPSSNVPLPLKSISVPRRSYVEQATELSVSTIKPKQRRTKTGQMSLTYDSLKTPFLVKKLSLQDPATKIHHDNLPGYEVYEALVKSQISRNGVTETIPVIIPVPNPTPSEQDKESILSKSLISLREAISQDQIDNMGPIENFKSADETDTDLRNSEEYVDAENKDSEKLNPELVAGDVEVSQKATRVSSQIVPKSNNCIIMQSEDVVSELQNENESESSTQLNRKPGIFSKRESSAGSGGSCDSEDNSEHQITSLVGLNVLPNFSSEADFTFNISESISDAAINDERHDKSGDSEHNL